MDKIFLTVLNMSLTGAFVIAAICLVRLPLKKAPKIISYCLWAVAGFRLIFPFSIESMFSLIPFKAQPIPQDIAMQAVPRIDSGIGVIDNTISTSLPAASMVTSVNPLQIWQFIGSRIWLFGVAALLIYGIASFVILKQKMRKSIHIEANIYQAENVQSPFVLGIFAPKIYLPIGLSKQEKNYIILHEQTHIRRHDHIIKFAAYFILCLHWFNPFAWMAFLLMGVDMEMSCDERVLKQIGSEAKKDYSLSLLSLATEQHIIGGSPLAFSEGGLKARIENVLNFRKPSWVIIVAAVTLVVALSVGFAVNRSDDIFPMTMNTVYKEPHFAGIVTQVYDNAVLVRVNEGEDERRSSDLISVSLNVKLKDSMRTFLAGDKVIVYYNGEIAESYPAQIDTVYAIVLTSPDMHVNIDDLNALFAMRMSYVGENSIVGKIVNALPRIDREHTQRFFSIGDDYGTSRTPFTLTIYYEPNDVESTDTRNITVTPKNAALLFALVDNLEEVNIAFRSTPSEGELDKEAYTTHVAYSKEDISEYLGIIGLNWEDFLTDWSGSVEKLYAVDGTVPESIDLRYQMSSYEEDKTSPVQKLVPPNFSGENTQDNAQLLANYFVEMLNQGVDLTGDNDAMESWQALYNFGQAPAEARNIRVIEYSDSDYIFDVVGVKEDMVMETTVRIIWHETMPRYSCEYTHYYPLVQPAVEQYLSLLIQGNAVKLARHLVVDGDYQSFVGEAEKWLEFYGRYDLESAKITTPMMYDNYRQNFYCVVLDKNEKGFVLKLTYGDGLIMPLSPFE